MAKNAELCTKIHTLMLRLAFLIFFSALFVLPAQAQMERTMYQVFEVDSMKTITLDIADIYDLHTWAGSAIMIETNIQLSNATPEILDFLIKEGRYDVRMDTLAPGEVKISTKIRDRKKIKTPAGECTEIPEAKVFVPDTFYWEGDKITIRRKEEKE